MIWTDRIAKELKGRSQHVDDMFTPSGYAHIGSLRGPILHDVIFKVLKRENAKTVFTYVFNDFDHIDGLSPDLTKDFSKYLGYPMRLVPSPDGKARSFADFFIDDFKKILSDLGCETEYLSSWDMYHEGKFNQVIRIALDNTEKIQDIYQRVSGSKKKEIGWYPLQVICPQCSKLGTTRVTDWDGQEVTFSCEKNLVSWASGCGYKGKISPFDGKGKLPWKVDWPAHWKVLGVTFEGAGKDHASRGGSYDIAFALCQEVFKYPKPYYFPYEHFLFGGRKMSSSKGVGLKARDLTTILPPELGRFLMVRTVPNRAIEFDPYGDTIANLFDEFDRCAGSFWDKTDNDLARIFELSMVNNWYQEKIYLPRFKTIIEYLKNSAVKDIGEIEQKLNKKLNDIEKRILKERVKYAKIWLEKFAPAEDKFTLSKDIPEGVKTLSLNQKKYLKKLAEIIEKENKAESLQTKLFDLAKESGISTKEAFQAIYIATIGKSYGPKAAQFLLSLDKKILKKRFLEIQEEVSKKISSSSPTSLFPILERSEIFSIDKKVKERFPSICVGIAIIKDVTIKKDDPKLRDEINEFLETIRGLTTEKIGKYREIESYRRIYKETGIDWHSRRPSPEALLRRIALNKGLYSINTCVDAYNLVVLKNRVSSGAFDLDKIKFPTVLRFARKGETIKLLGDLEETDYKEGEIAYFDRLGGFNIDFNYRDAERTKVTEKTKNLWINVDGVYDVTPSLVENTLKETIEIITKYCGGVVELAGLVT